MASRVRYYPSGKRAEEWGSEYTSWDQDGTVTSARPLTEDEQRDLDAIGVSADEAGRSASLRTQADQAIAALEGATRTKNAWDALPPAQRQEMTRLGLLAVAKIARLVLGRLDSA